MTSEFVHLHNHSDYSLLDGAQRIDQLVNTIDDLKTCSVDDFILEGYDPHPPIKAKMAV